MLNNLLFYVEGKNPTAREMQNLLILIESSLVLSIFNSQRREDNDQKYIKSKNNSFEKYLEEKYDTEFEKTAHHDMLQLLRFTEFSTRMYDYEFEKFLRFIERNSEKYEFGSAADARSFYKREISNIEDQVHTLHRRFQEGEGRKYRKFNLFNGPRLLDLSEWISDEFGNKLLPTVHVSTKNSIEHLFSLASVVSILGCQHTPEVKDLALYVEGYFKEWIGSGKFESKPPIKIPKLPASVARTIDGYDDVEIECTADKFTIRLKKTP